MVKKFLIKIYYKIVTSMLKSIDLHQIIYQQMNVPYCIIKGKARLGRVVRRKTCAAMCLTNTHPEDKSALSKVVEAVKNNFNDRSEEVGKLVTADDLNSMFPSNANSPIFIYSRLILRFAVIGAAAFWAASRRLASPRWRN